jgi:hypothetical protein
LCPLIAPGRRDGLGKHLDKLLENVRKRHDNIPLVSLSSFPGNRESKIKMTSDILVGLVALALVPLIALRIRRGLRDGRLPIYRTYVQRDEQPGRFRFMLALHCLSLLLIAVAAADLLLGLGIRDRL